MADIDYILDEKRRRVFNVYCGADALVRGDRFAHGVLYDEGNVQVLWRKDVGWCAEQHANLYSVFGLVDGANIVEILDDE